MFEARCQSDYFAVVTTPAALQLKSFALRDLKGTEHEELNSKQPQLQWGEEAGHHFTSHDKAIEQAHLKLWQPAKRKQHSDINEL